MQGILNYFEGLLYRVEYVVSSTKFIEGKKLYKKIFVYLIFFCLFFYHFEKRRIKIYFFLFVIFVDTADGRTRTLIES